MPFQYKTSRGRQLPPILPREPEIPQDGAKGDTQEDLPIRPVIPHATTRKRRDPVVAACERCRKRKVKVVQFLSIERSRNLQG